MRSRLNFSLYTVDSFASSFISVNFVYSKIGDARVVIAQSEALNENLYCHRFVMLMFAVICHSIIANGKVSSSTFFTLSFLLVEWNCTFFISHLEIIYSSIVLSIVLPSAQRDKLNKTRVVPLSQTLPQDWYQKTYLKRVRNITQRLHLPNFL